MLTSHLKPAFIAFTGVDDPRTIGDLQALSERYPIEWGVLVHPDRNGPPFADPALLERLRSAGVRLSAHLCGPLAAAVVKGRPTEFEVAGFSRVQINHMQGRADGGVVARASRYAACQGVRAVLKCSGAFPPDGRVDWLHHLSLGKDVRPRWLPQIYNTHPFCGVSGGIDPHNVIELLSARLIVSMGVPFWIDIETGVRTDGLLDVDKCAAVCAAVYG